ncbi:hypothetical protein [Actinomadura fibrosa]|uniref:Uncharacterized protein n=1 Tax=Actinomadura fibrosa TaxID=111802 RepID=A0ABW2Y2M8_9ACTN|nr:hypothetical protein [Actinomadura fibrosa]
MPEVFTGKVEFKNKNGTTILTIDPDSGFVDIVYKTSGGQQMMQLTNTGSFSLAGPGDDHGARMDGSLGDLFLGGGGKVGTIRIRDAVRNDVIVLEGADGTVSIGSSGHEGNVILRDGSGRTVFEIDGNTAGVFVGANGNEGDVVVRNGSGAETIRLDGGSGDIILTNADCAEDFEASADAEAGTVMVLSEGGAVVPCESPYDRRVAGVVSGAGGLRPGIVLGRRPAETRCPLALIGKVFCKADADHGPIGLGDMLTTSPTQGHAMRALDPMRAFGSVLGKALGELRSGQGLVPVLVALQ